MTSAKDYYIRAELVRRLATLDDRATALLRELEDTTREAERVKRHLQHCTKEEDETIEQ